MGKSQFVGRNHQDFCNPKARLCRASSLRPGGSKRAGFDGVQSRLNKCSPAPSGLAERVARREEDRLATERVSEEEEAMF